MSKARAPRRSKKRAAARERGGGPPRREEPAKGRRFTPEQREHALRLIVSGMRRAQVASVIGTTTESLRRWTQEAKRRGTMPRLPGDAPEGERVRPRNGDPEPAVSGGSRSPYAARDPGQGLSDEEQEAILELKRRHPSMQAAQIRAQLKRFKGWRLSRRAIARVLRHNGYEPVHRGGRPVGPEPVRFEAPRRNALWQMDFAELWVAGTKLALLVVLDDFSRYAVGHRLCEVKSSEVAAETLKEAIARHGKPEAVRTDRGGEFASVFRSYLEAELIDHVVGRAYHPQGGGKVESLIGTVRRELFEVEHFDDQRVAERRLAEWITDYNERRAHMGLDGLTPADRFFGRADRVLALIDAVSRKRQGVLAQERTDRLIEEATAPGSGAPFEVLRLVVVEGEMELRFCGARVRLGPVES